MLLIISYDKIILGDGMKKERRKLRPIFKILIALFIFVASFLLYAHFISTSGLVVKEYLVVNEELPESFYGTKIIQMSDIHYGRTTSAEDLRNIVKKINSYNPDIVVLTGDLLDRDKKYTNKELEELSNILADINVTIKKYAIMGNHDNTQNKWKEVITNSGFINLGDTYEIIYNNSYEPILIAGMSTGQYSNATPSEKVNDAISLLINNEDSTNTINYGILLMHEPDYIDDIDYNNFNLIMAGHTHNGQVRLPFFGAIILPPHGRNYYENHYSLDNTDLYISSGIGTSNIDLRLFNRPSINLYRLVNK